MATDGCLCLWTRHASDVHLLIYHTTIPHDRNFASSFLSFLLDFWQLYISVYVYIYWPFHCHCWRRQWQLFFIDLESTRSPFIVLTYSLHTEHQTLHLHNHGLQWYETIHYVVLPAYKMGMYYMLYIKVWLIFVNICCGYWTLWCDNIYTVCMYVY